MKKLKEVTSKMYRKVQSFFCRFRGHKYSASAFTANALYFCERCHQEIGGYTFDDLEPMTTDELEELDMFDDNDWN